MAVRNKNIADIFFKAGYIEAWGRGISMIMDTCRKAGLLEPAIEEMAGGMQITFLKNLFSIDYLKQLGLNERQIDAVAHLKKNGKITNKEYQEINNCSRNTASSDLADMVEKNILKPSSAKGAGSFYELK